MMSGYYAKNPHYAPDDFSEAVDRLERCEEHAGRWFADATQDQLATFNRTIADLRGLEGPRYDRARDAAKAVWTATTASASELYHLTVADLMATGEISESLAERWDALPTANMLAVA